MKQVWARSSKVLNRPISFAGSFCLYVDLRLYSPRPSTPGWRKWVHAAIPGWFNSIHNPSGRNQ